MEQYRYQLRWAVEEYNGPVAIRYPRGGNGTFTECSWDPETDWVCHRTGKDLTILTYGTMVNQALDAAMRLSADGLEIGVIRFMNLTDLNLKDLPECGHFLILEEMNTGSGVSEALCAQLAGMFPGCRTEVLDLGREFVPHGNIRTLYHHYGLDGASIADHIKEVLGK